MPLFTSDSLRTSSTALPCAAARCCSSISERSVAVVPGWMMLTLTPSRSPSLDRPFEKLATAALTEAPIRNSASGVRPAPPPEQPAEAHAAEEFQRESVEPEVVGQLREATGPRRARVVDEHITALEALVDIGKYLLATGERAQVTGDGQRLRRARLFGVPGDLLRCLGERRRIRRGKHGLRALFREARRDGLADAAARAADHHDLVLELSCHRNPLVSSAVLIASTDRSVAWEARGSGVERAALTRRPRHRQYDPTRGGRPLKPAPFAYARASSVAHAVELLERHDGDAKLLAGGQSLIATLNMRLSSPAL